MDASYPTVSRVSAQPIVTANEPLFSVAIDPSRRALYMVMNGRWDRSTSDRFTAAVASAIERLLGSGIAFGTLRTLIDVRAAAVMPQDIVGRLLELSQSHGAASERIAMLLGGMLQKMQFQRTVASPGFQAFFDEADANAWLFAD